ncbi:ABC transporter [Acrocarpospora phusangensis]|uniref:ABC transporter n=1 Tax=Acrocarpospora phusangensis TaxID=1070424 RepID=A0A919Q8B8_9ACTN|nr:ABC transporter permease [Acrocarpospora phusangensis]GIH24187.1 ABC transporter [Acrocarpospora phusangensis]
MIAYIRLEVRKTARDSGYVVMGLAVPVTMYLLFSTLAIPAEARPEGALWSMIGMAAYGALGGVFSNGTGTAEDKSLGWMRQLRLTPISPARVIAGKTATSAIIVVPAIALVLAAGAFVNQVRLEPVQWITVIALLWAGTIPFSLLALGNGYLLSPQNAASANLAGYIGLSVVGGLWFPTTNFPGWLGAAASWSPVNGYANLSWSVAFDHSPDLRSALVLLGWFAVFAGYARFGYLRSGRVV